MALVYFLLVVVLTTYVLLVSPFRSEMLTADAWEHLAAVQALTTDFWSPGNPTYATDDPSVRFSPYSVTLAAISNATGVSPFAVLTAGGAFNVAAFFIALWFFLGRFGRLDVAVPAAFTIVLLYGRAPGYANSFAFSDLPWHGVNPSTLSMALNLVCWGLVYGVSRSRPPAAAVTTVAVAGLLSVSLLCHGMSGVLGAIGVVALGVVTPPGKRLRHAAVVAGVALGSLALCAAWPWYPFLDALRGGASDFDTAYWFNVGVLKRMLLVWCPPVYLFSLLALPLRREPLVRWSLTLAWLAVGLGLLGMAARSASLARLPLAATPLAAVAVACWIREARFLAPGWARATARGLVSTASGGNAGAVVHVLVFVAFLLGAVPQALDTLTSPYLARSLVASALGRPDKQPHLRERYADLLDGAEPGEVVLGERDIVWPVPSFGGRVVAAAHMELFTPAQRQRWGDTAVALTTSDPAEREAVLNRYGVDSVVVLRDGPHAGIIREDAVERSAGPLVRMNARAWAAAMRAPASSESDARPLRLPPPATSPAEAGPPVRNAG